MDSIENTELIIGPAGLDKISFLLSDTLDHETAGVISEKKPDDGKN